MGGDDVRGEEVGSDDVRGVPLELRDMNPVLQQYLQSLSSHYCPTNTPSSSVWRELQTMAGIILTLVMSCDGHVISRVSEADSCAGCDPEVSSATHQCPLQASEHRLYT